MKLKELRLLNIKIIKDGETIYDGTTEELPEELKELEYKKIYFEGVNVIAEF